MKRPQVEEPEIPTASMADIAFLLIVFFMLTTVFSANKGMEHLLPPKEDIPDEQIDNEEAIYIQIYPSGQFVMDQKPYSIDDVETVHEYVFGKVQQNAKKPIILHTNREAKYGDMVAVFNQLKRVGKELETELAITIPSKEEAERYARFGVQ
ncbi:MAG: biopolymer transporter ExbD [Acidobacteria bacterium]|nr:biopolymer transporter ExbD [Acidobacteriota bacterium]